MRLIIVKLAKGDDGTIASRMKDFMPGLQSYLDNTPANPSTLLTRSNDGSVMAWLLDSRDAARDIARDIAGLPFWDSHDNLFVSDLGGDHWGLSLNVPMTWLERRRPRPRG